MYAIEKVIIKISFRMNFIPIGIQFHGAFKKSSKANNPDQLQTCN